MIKSRHTDEEKQQCVNEYLNGKDKDYLANKYSTTTRSINRWIKSSNIDEIKLRMLKRAKTISIEIQEEILKALNINPICEGFNISVWNELMLIRYINSKYGIEINKRMAKGLIEDSKKIEQITYDEKITNDIEQLADQGYSIVLVDYIQIGRIASSEIESRYYKKEMLDVNLVIARAGEDMYLDVIVSDLDVVDRINEMIITSNNKIKRTLIINDKLKILTKICKEEENDRVVFITTYDSDMKKIINRDSSINWFIVEDELYKRMIHPVYEGEHGKTVVEYMYDKKNKDRVYRKFIGINKAIKGKIDKYVSNVTRDKIEYAKKNKCNRANEEENMKKYIKILKSEFINNI